MAVNFASALDLPINSANASLPDFHEYLGILKK
jgi:hypothetical protein